MSLVMVRKRFVQFVQPGSKINGECGARIPIMGVPVGFRSKAPGQGADESLANKSLYFALKSVRIGNKNVNTKLL